MKRVRIEYSSAVDAYVKGYCEVYTPQTLIGYKALVKTVKILLDRGHEVKLRCV